MEMLLGTERVTSNISEFLTARGTQANKFYLSCRASTHAWELRWLRVSPGEVCLYRKRDDVDAKPFWTPSGPSRYALRGVTVADAPRHVIALDLAPIYTTAAGGREPDALGSFDDESLSEPVAMRAFMLAPNGARPRQHSSAARARTHTGSIIQVRSSTPRSSG